VAEVEFVSVTVADEPATAPPLAEVAYVAVAVADEPTSAPPLGLTE
jgi:hypothetical protein